MMSPIHQVICPDESNTSWIQTAELKPVNSVEAANEGICGRGSRIPRLHQGTYPGVAGALLVLLVGRTPILMLHSSAQPLRSAVNQECWMQSPERQVHLQFMGVPFLARWHILVQTGLQHRPPPCRLIQHHVAGHLITTGRLSLTLVR